MPRQSQPSRNIGTCGEFYSSNPIEMVSSNRLEEPQIRAYSDSNFQAGEVDGCLKLPSKSRYRCDWEDRWGIGDIRKHLM
jgi:hypothetical protein